MSKPKLEGILKILQSASLILGIAFTCYQVNCMAKTYRAAEKVNSANFVLKISDELDKDKYDMFRYAIEDHDGRFKIQSTKGHRRFSDHEIDDYIGNFETLGNFVEEDLVTEQMVYNQLGYDIEKAWCNRDVYDYIKDSRKADGAKSGPNAFYSGFERLAAYSLSRDGKKCADMDKE